MTVLQVCMDFMSYYSAKLLYGNYSCPGLHLGLIIGESGSKMEHVPGRIMLLFLLDCYQGFTGTP